jgi:hypothetical protein
VPYRYEDLDDKSFQRLCAALLVHLDQTVQVPPLGQSDGGFDAYRRAPGEVLKLVGHQVKWTGKPGNIKNPVTWIMSQLNSEEENLRRMAGSGTKSYLMITNVPSTSKPGVGRMDSIDTQITRLGRKVGLDIYVWWRADLDARLDAAPADLKFAYPNMLVGADAMRALFADMLQGEKLRKQIALIRAATSTAWANDRNVGFRQGKLDGVPLDSLFVDVTATRKYTLGESTGKMEQPGALKLLLSAAAPMRMLLFGAPGQGKSTLVQKLCQEHRHLFLNPPSATEFEVRSSRELDTPRVVFKIVLRDYAQWLTGNDPLSATDKKRPPRATDSVESFVAHVLKDESGGMSCAVEDVVAIVNRFPSLFAFDGLDEVADATVRERVVREISNLTSRADQWDATPRILITSRPSFSRLPEPSSDVFIQFNMDAVSESLRIEYLRKWSRSQDLPPRDRRDVERVFRERSGEAHVRELATNPMQLTILLYLIYQRRDSIPQRRTNLYQDYLQAFLDREASKSELVKRYREELEDITAFLGWHLQSRAEEESGNGRATREELIRATKYFLVDNGRNELVSVVEDLFTTVTERVWALTSRASGTFEFDVQSIREYFAARYLFDRAPIAFAESESDVFARFREAAARPYWSNTARLMAGLFRYGEKAHLADDLIQQIIDGGLKFWPRRIALTLVRDGIFDDQPAPRLRLIEAAHDRVGLRIAVRDIDDGFAPTVPADRGGSDLANLLEVAISSRPDDDLALERARLLSEYRSTSELVPWWSEQVRKGAASKLRWLQIGNAAGIGPGLGTGHLASLEPLSTDEAVALLAMGADPGTNTQNSESMLSVVLNGRINGRDASGRSLGAAVANVVDIAGLLVRADSVLDVIPEWDRKAMARLRAHSGAVANRLQSARRERGGNRGTTAVFAALADAIHEQFGRCWLANEVAVVGASTTLRTGHSTPKDAQGWGATGTPSALLRDMRANRADLTWWIDQQKSLADPVDRLSWLLGALTTTTITNVPALLTAVQPVLSRIDDEGFEVLWASISRLESTRGVRAFPSSALSAAAALSAELTALVSLLIVDDDDFEALTIIDLGLLSSNREVVRDYATRIIWAQLKMHEELDAELAGSLVDANTNLPLPSPPTRSAPTSLTSRVSASSPWVLLEWANGSAELSESRSSLAQFAEANSWFAPAS